MQVLIADDDPVLRFALVQHLERWAFEVIECVDGDEAWQAMQEPSSRHLPRLYEAASS